MGWDSEEEYARSLVAACGRCGSVEVLDAFRDETLCFDCWWEDHATYESLGFFADTRVDGSLANLLALIEGCGGKRSHYAALLKKWERGEIQTEPDQRCSPEEAARRIKMAKEELIILKQPKGSPGEENLRKLVAKALRDVAMELYSQRGTDWPNMNNADRATSIIDCIMNALNHTATGLTEVSPSVKRRSR